MAKVLKNPVTRNKIATMFKLEFTDEQIARKLDYSKSLIVSTRMDMGLKRTCNRYVNGRKLTREEQSKGGSAFKVKKKPMNKQARVNPFAVLRAYLDQDVKNMSKVAEKFKCSRQYVSRVLQEARGTIDQPGILNERNQLYIANTEAILEHILED